MSVQTYDFMIGKTVSKIKTVYGNDDLVRELIFIFGNGDRCKFYHNQECCKDVWIDGINGELDWLLDREIITAKAVSQENETPLGIALPHNHDDDDPYTWTFYKIGTMIGTITVRWFGASNWSCSGKADFAVFKDVDMGCEVNPVSRSITYSGVEDYSMTGDISNLPSCLTTHVRIPRRRN